MDIDTIDLEAMRNMVYESVLPSTNTASRSALRDYVESLDNRGLIYLQDLHTSLDETVLGMNQFRMTGEELTRTINDLVWKHLSSVREEDIPIEVSSDLDKFLQSINIKPS